MEWRRIWRVLLEPAKDPLRDSFGLSVERVRELRIRLSQQLIELRTRAGKLNDSAFDDQIHELQAQVSGRGNLLDRGAHDADEVRRRQRRGGTGLGV